MSIKELKKSYPASCHFVTKSHRLLCHSLLQKNILRLINKDSQWTYVLLQTSLWRRQFLPNLMRGYSHLLFGNQCLGTGTKWCCVHTLTLSTRYVTLNVVNSFRPVRRHFETWAKQRERSRPEYKVSTLCSLGHRVGAPILAWVLEKRVCSH